MNGWFVFILGNGTLLSLFYIRKPYKLNKLVLEITSRKVLEFEEKNW